MLVLGQTRALVTKEGSNVVEPGQHVEGGVPPSGHVERRHCELVGRFLSVATRFPFRFARLGLRYQEPQWEEPPQLLGRLVLPACGLGGL